MTRTLSANLEAHFGDETTTIATLWKLTRRDSTVMGFTNHDQNIVYDGVTYIASTGFTPSDISQKSDFSVNNQEIQSILDSSYITEVDLFAGIYDYAEVEVSMINYKVVADGVVVVSRGWLGQIQIKDGAFSAEIRGLSEKINKNIGQIYSPLCRATLGDTRCAFNMATNISDGLGATVTGVAVTAVTSNQVFTASSISSRAAGIFTNGELIWTSGTNSGYRMEIKDSLEGVITLALPMQNAIDVADQFTIKVGCDKDFLTCKNRFNNVLNFRGEPHVPGQDAALETAGTFTSS
jgi:uncharacterized phage protein (TIGR02218 family)